MDYMITRSASKLILPSMALLISLSTSAIAFAETSAFELQKRIWKGQCVSGCRLEKQQLELQLTEDPIIEVKDFTDRPHPYPKKAIFSSGMRAILKVEESYFPIQKSEVLAYRIDQLFDLNLVPVTILRNVDGKLSSLQLFVEGAENASERGLTNKEKPQEILLFDFLTRNFDRHTQNWMYFPTDDHPIAVDNDQSFAVYAFEEVMARFPLPLSPKITELQYKNLCKVQPMDIQRVVFDFFEGEIGQKISDGINKSRIELIRLFEDENATGTSCIN